MKRITWKEAEKILGGRLDRRKAYYFNDDSEIMEYLGGGPVFDYGEWTAPCSGCSCDCECGCSCCNEKGSGCHECGYTGKRRDGWHSPVSLSSNATAQTPPNSGTKDHE